MRGDGNGRSSSSADMGGSRAPPPVDTASAGMAGGAVVDEIASVPSPRLSAAEKRLQEEKQWLEDLPRYCFAEPNRGSDFVWSFRVSGLHGTMYQVRVPYMLHGRSLGAVFFFFCHEVRFHRSFLSISGK